MKVFILEKKQIFTSNPYHTKKIKFFCLYETYSQKIPSLTIFQWSEIKGCKMR
jgi:hypothetical protein